MVYDCWSFDQRTQMVKEKCCETRELSGETGETCELSTQANADVVAQMMTKNVMMTAIIRAYLVE